jgi:drug/metabolite transporter (DMT)-like permease
VLFCLGLSFLIRFRSQGAANLNDSVVPTDISSPSHRGQRPAEIALIVATVFWGCGFTWAKAGADAIHHTLGLPQGTPFGPIFLLGWRFLIGGIVWMLLFPASLRGWNITSLLRAMLLGFLCAVALIVQHLGLDRTTEAVSAFITSLTIIFVPLLMTVVLRRPPRPVLWAGVVLATAGVWLMTGATPAGFGLGEVLGLLCSFTFSLYILAVNAILPRESPWRMTGAQFLTISLICFATCACLRVDLLRPVIVAQVLRIPQVWINLALLSVFTTLGAFGLLTHFQPRLDATRSALIYLLEPIFAAAYAAIAVHRHIGASGFVGAAMILVANLLVEVISSRRKQVEPTMLVD